MKTKQKKNIKTLTRRCLPTKSTDEHFPIFLVVEKTERKKKKKFSIKLLAIYKKNISIYITTTVDSILLEKKEENFSIKKKCRFKSAVEVYIYIFII